jgi:predicted transcriptional regulator
MENKVDWKKMGFKSYEEYQKFLDDKAKKLMDKITNDPKLLNVFKRLYDR